MERYKPIGRTPGGTRKLRAYRSTKKKVLNRDNFKCVKCKTDAEVTHHIIPVWQDRNKVNDVDNIESLCKKCHLEIHYKKSKKYKKYKSTK